MCARLGKHLGRISEVEGRLHKPITAMDEDENRRLCAIGTEDVELFDFCRSISNLSRRSDADPNGFANSVFLPLNGQVSEKRSPPLSLVKITMVSRAIPLSSSACSTRPT